MTAAEIAEAAAAARDLDLVIELGTKGIDPGHLETFLRLADAFDARLVRSMLFAPESRPSLAGGRADAAHGAPRVRGGRGHARPRDVRAGRDRRPRRRSSSGSGPTTSASASTRRTSSRGWRLPRAAVERCAPLTKNIHVKDFAFARQDGWVGFTYSGAPMGAGLHDYPHLLDAPSGRGERGINEIVEHWLPWQGDADTTIPPSGNGPASHSNT